MAPISTTKEAGGEGGVAHKFFYPSTDADVGVVQYSTTAGASAALTRLVAAAANRAIKARGAFTIALTGEQGVSVRVRLGAYAQAELGLASSVIAGSLSTLGVRSGLF